MNNDLSTKTACIVDSGLFVGLALSICKKLSNQGFSRVLYHTPFDEDHQRVQQVCWGDGFGAFGIERCDDIWKELPAIDLFIFPDNGHVGLQLYLESIGKRVVGSKAGQDLETLRRRFRKMQSKLLHMDTPEYVIITGITALRQHLEPLEDKYIKIDRFRGNFETFHWRDYPRDNGALDKWAVEFGPFKEHIPFMVEDAIKTDIEDGGDFFIVDGQTPSHCVIGVEKKNQSYMAFLREYDALDSQIREALEPLLPILKDRRYRNFLSTEQRKTKTDNYLTDITTRLGFPSGCCQLKLYDNLPALLYAAGAGEMIPIETSAEVCIEVLLHHCGDVDDWRTMHVPKELWPWFNPKECCLEKETVIFAPQAQRNTCIGSINGIGATIEQAYTHVSENLELLKDQPVTGRLDTITDLLKEVHEAEEQGIKFTDTELPEAKELVADE